MSTVIAMAYAQYGTVMHFTSSVRHLEEIRRVTSRLSELVTESERARLDLQMLFGVHVWSRAKVVPDCGAFARRGGPSRREAPGRPERSSSSPPAAWRVTLLDLGDVEGAERWLGLAAAAASNAPSRTRSIQLETWRGMVASGCRRRGRHAPPPREGRRDGQPRAAGPPARCEALARLAIEAVAARRCVRTRRWRTGSGACVELVERSAAQVKELLPLLPGHAPWGAQADAALATVALARGDIETAAMAGGAAFQALQAALHEDVSLEIVIPAARAVLAGGPPEMQGFVRGFLQQTLARIAQGTADEKIRVRWLTGPVGRELVELAGPWRHRLRQPPSRVEAPAAQPGQPSSTMPSAACSSS